MKLYPPTISSSIPAFYDQNGTVVITVPFTMNRAVSRSQISGFALKIKTAQSNNYVTTLLSNQVNSAIANKQISFTWNLTSDTNGISIRPGQFLKFQLAYKDTEENTGYFSTVAVGKYTTAATAQITQYSEHPDRILNFTKEYTGEYILGDDKTERPYAYKFTLYNQLMEVVETSDWKPHNSLLDVDLDSTLDTYTFGRSLEDNNYYYLQYSVKTINDLIVTSPLYSCMSAAIADSRISDINMIVENNFEEGYINLSFVLNNSTISDLDISSEYSILIERSDSITNFKSWDTIKKAYFSSKANLLAWSFKDMTVEQGVIYKYRFGLYDSFGNLSQQIESNEVMADFEDMFLYDGNKQIKIRFNPKVSSFKETILESKVDTIGSKYPYVFRNKMVGYKEFPISGLISYLMDNNEMFLKKSEYDIQEESSMAQNFNCISCVSQTPQDVFNTIINNTFNNKTFLLSTSSTTDFLILTNDEYSLLRRDFSGDNVTHNVYKVQEECDDQYNTRYDEAESSWQGFNESEIGTWPWWLRELKTRLDGINKILEHEIYYIITNIISISSYRESTPTENTLLTNLPTTDLVSYNMRAERQFKMRLLDWLNDGQIKLFRSPAEGNYLVRLMNVSLTPEDQVGRMLHTFSAQAYEMDGLNYNNLLKYGFLSDKEEETVAYIPQSDEINVIVDENDIGFKIKCNSQKMWNQLSIDLSNYSNISSSGIYFRFGLDESTKFYVQKGSTITIQAKTENGNDTPLPDLYFMAIDNPNIASLNEIIITYDYRDVSVHTGNIEDNTGNTIRSIYVSLASDTIYGSVEDESESIFNIASQPSGHNFIKFLNIQFHERGIIEGCTYTENIIYNGNTITPEIADKTSIYKVSDQAQYIVENGSWTEISDQIEGKIKITSKENSEEEIDGLSVSLEYADITKIDLSNAPKYYCTLIWQERVTEFVDESSQEENSP